MQNSYAAFVRHGAAGPLRAPAAQRWVLICLKRLCLPARLLLLQPTRPRAALPAHSEHGRPRQTARTEGRPTAMVWAQIPAACSRHAAEAAEAAPRARGSLRCALSVFAPMKGPTYPDKVVYSRTGPNL